MLKRIERVAVLGAGTMGSRIAAHLANAGVRSYLLDIVPPEAHCRRRRRWAATALPKPDWMRRASPSLPPSWSRGWHAWSTTGNFEDHLGLLAGCDWIIEAVVEESGSQARSAAQGGGRAQARYHRHHQYQRPARYIPSPRASAKISAATGSALIFSIRRATCACWRSFPRRRAIRRRLRPWPSSPASAWAKGIVYAKDTPNFVANRIGTFSVLNIMRLMQEFDFSIEEVDALTGSAIGFPKSATFRTIDMVGLDVLDHVVQERQAAGAGLAPEHGSRTPSELLDERGDLELPAFYEQMIERKLLGDKTEGGLLQERAREDGESRLAMDWKTLEYRPAQRPKFPSLEMAKNVDSLGERLRMLTGFGGEKLDKAGEFLWTRAVGAVHLLGQPDSRDQRQRGGDRPRHAPGLQLGDGAVRAMGCGRRSGLGGAHEAGGQAGFRQRGEAARRLASRAGIRTLLRPRAAAPISISPPHSTQGRRRLRRASGA